MQSDPINFNTTKAIFRAPHIEVAWRDAAPCCVTYLLIICRINAELLPPPTLHLLSVGVHTSIETVKGNSCSVFPVLTLTSDLSLCPQGPCLRQVCCGLFFLVSRRGWVSQPINRFLWKSRCLRNCGGTSIFLVGVGFPNPSDEWIVNLPEGKGI